MVKSIKKKTCFVIAPIGAPSSAVRKRSDNMFKFIIEPVVRRFNYNPVRADQITRPGSITNQIIENIIQSNLVIADLTGHNANVFYELAIRHASRKPVIQIIEKGEIIPFDIAFMRTIYVDIQDLESVDEAKNNIMKQIETIESGNFNIDNPISLAMDIDILNQSKNEEQRVLSDLVRIMAGRMEALANLEFEEKLAVLSHRKEPRYFEKKAYSIEDTKNNFRSVSYLKNWVQPNKREDLIINYIIPILEIIKKFENKLSRKEIENVLEIIDIALDYNLDLDTLNEIKNHFLKKSLK